MEGCRWDREKKKLGEMKPKQLHDELPIVLFQPSVLPEEVEEVCRFIIKVAKFLYQNIFSYIFK